MLLATSGTNPYLNILNQHKQDKSNHDRFKNNERTPLSIFKIPFIEFNEDLQKKKTNYSEWAYEEQNIHVPCCWIISITMETVARI